MRKFSIPYKWEIVILLWFAFFFNQADRQIFNVVLPLIRDDLHLTDANMGLISTILNLCYGILVPIAGILGDKISKKKIIIASLFVWSAATLITGFSATLFELILLRSVATGGGEAFYSPSANSVISEEHDEKTRATALSIHQTALYFGVIFSGYIAGLLAERLGWRHTFYLFGGFGVLLAIILHFRMRDSVVSKKTDGGDNADIKAALGVFFKTPTVLLLSLAFAFMQFVGVGFLTWMPTFLHENFDLSLARSGFDATFYHNIGSFLGVLLGARIADVLVERYYKVRILIQAIGLLLGAPFIFMMAKSNALMVVYASMFFFGISKGMFDSNIFSSLYQVIPLRFRATATGLMLMFAFIIGSISPFLLGLYKPIFGLQNGLAYLSVIYILGSVLLFFVIGFVFSNDYGKIHNQEA